MYYMLMLVKYLVAKLNSEKPFGDSYPNCKTKRHSRQLSTQTFLLID